MRSEHVGIARTITVLQGQFHVSSRRGDVLSTVLGSCVAACIHDPRRGLGGMNHFLLPGADPRDARNIKYGAFLMERLINAILRAGGDRHDLEGKIFGGARVVDHLSDIGRGNAEFAHRFLADEGIRVVDQCVGGRRGRRVRFWPKDGHAQVLKLDPLRPEVSAQTGPAGPVPPAVGGSGDVDIF